MNYGDKVLLKEYKNGNKLWGTVCKCVKCGGTGKVIWSYADHVCFDCDGKGWYYYEEREYTPANLAKLEAKREKARLAELEAQREREAAEERERAERERKEEERRAAEAARKAISQYIGKEGERLTATVTLTKSVSFEVPAFRGWGTDLKHIYILTDANGNKLVWKSTAALGKWDDEDQNKWISVNDGDTITIKATIKGHSEYEGEKQTEIQRVKWIG